MSEYDDLVERLRSVDKSDDHELWESAPMLDEAARAIQSLQAQVEELKGNSIPHLPNCGKYQAVDNKGQWHYLNHANAWQGMPDLTVEARNAALEEAAVTAQTIMKREAQYYCESKGDFGRQMEASGGIDVAEEIASAIRALKKEG